MSSLLPYDRHSLASSIAGKGVLTTGVSQGRSAEKVQATVSAIKVNPASAVVLTHILVLNLASQAQIKEAAKEVLAYLKARIDVPVNSAGTMAGPYRTTKDSLEAQFGSNSIGHFLFTNLIMRKLLAAPRPVVVNVLSNGHRFSGVRFDDPCFQNGEVYDKPEAYGQSKSANILFSTGLAEKLGGKGVGVYSLNPGTTFGTSLAGEGFKLDEAIGAAKAIDEAFGWKKGFQMKTLGECAATHVVAAFDTRLERYNGAFLDDGNVSEPQATAGKLEDVERLWKLSEELVGESFTH